jgi:hypothetical protein
VARQGPDAIHAKEVGSQSEEECFSSGQDLDRGTYSRRMDQIGIAGSWRIEVIRMVESYRKTFNAAHLLAKDEVPIYPEAIVQ